MRPIVVSILITSIILLSLPLAQGANYSPSVMVGDRATYTVSGQTTSMVGMQNAGSIKIEVQGISGSNVSMIMTTTLGGMMGSQTSHKGWFNLQEGIGSMDLMDMMETMNGDMGMGLNMTMMGEGMMESGEMNMSFFMAGGLNAGNSIYQGAPITFNQTLMRSYLGVSREVNRLQVMKTFNGHTYNMTTCWDVSTGVMTEYTATQTGSTQAISLKLSSTNLWGSLGLYPLGPALMIALLSLAVLTVKRTSTPLAIRKSQKPVPPTTSTAA